MTVQHGSHTVTMGRYAPPASGGVSVRPEQILCDNAAQGDAPVSVVVTVVPLALVFVYGNYLGVPHVLRYSSVLPALATDFVQWEQ